VKFLCVDFGSNRWKLFKSFTSATLLVRYCWCAADFLSHGWLLCEALKDDPSDEVMRKRCIEWNAVVVGWKTA
jgi:hypothetical protein